MIPNHPQFLEALQEQRKVRVQFYSRADSGVLDRVCAPTAYGLGGEPNDGLNRYWLWDFASETGSCALGLAPQQIVDLQVLSEKFDPAQFASAPVPVSPAGDLPPAPPVPVAGAITPKL